MTSSKDKKLFTILGSIILTEGKKKFIPTSVDYFNTLISSLPIGKKLSCTFSDRVPKRSEAQLAYHWVLVGLIADHTGDTREELHDAVMRIKFGTKTISLTGRDVEVRRSISNAGRMTVSDVVELITFDLEVCQSLDIHVPTPEELGYVSNHGGYRTLTPVRRELSTN